MFLPVSRRPRRLALVCGVVVAFSLCSAQAFAREVKVGVLAYQGESAAMSDWAPVMSYLDGALPEHDFHLHGYDFAGLREAIAEQRVDLVITNPGDYVTLEADFGISRIATRISSESGSVGHAIGAVVFTRADHREVHALPDLVGKKAAAVSPQAFGGYLVAAREMQQQGVSVESDIEEMRFVGLPMERVIDAVQRGSVDAGIVRACLLEQLARERRLDLADFRILSPRGEAGFPCAHSTALYPDWPLAVTRQTDPVLARAVARALLAAPDAGGGPRWTVPADYRPVHELYRELRVGPYAYLRETTPEGLARRFWPWLLGVTALLVAWIIHSVRAEHLVQQRTSELRESLQARKLAEEKMREHQEKMEHLSRLSVLGELSGCLAHEINQPLTTIGTYARTVLRRNTGGTLTGEAVVEACTEIANEAQRAEGIVRRIRHFAQKRAASREPVDLAAIAEDARRLLTGMLSQAPSIAIVDKRARRACCALADGAQVQQVLLNLIKNAIDACRELPCARQAIQVIVEMEDQRLLTHVVDQGPGLDAADRERLFEPFFTTKPDGLGLGLSICKTIIEAHGGRLWGEPNPQGYGMRFSFSLPCHEHSICSVSCPCR